VVFAWPGPPFVTRGEISADVRDGMEASAFGTTEASRLPGRVALAAWRSRLPLPRVDLLKSDRYMFGSLQISRGCPFTCRRPRLKTSNQVLAELESFRRAGLGIIFVVDDNLIGNKKAIKPVIREIIRPLALREDRVEISLAPVPPVGGLASD
jgi:radical SAM superfamily enzyme YgiQ (UPF0313 family)